MSQQDEGRLELVATQRFYAQLASSSLLGQYRDARVVASFGIGRGSGQIEPLMNFKGGMNDVHLLAIYPSLLEKALNEDSNRIHNAFLQSSPNEVVVIALKSGCALYLEDHPHFFDVPNDVDDEEEEEICDGGDLNSDLNCIQIQSQQDSTTANMHSSTTA